MKVYSTCFTLSTEDRTEISDITKLVRDAVQQFAVTTGVALVSTRTSGRRCSVATSRWA